MCSVYTGEAAKPITVVYTGEAGKPITVVYTGEAGKPITVVLQSNAVCCLKDITENIYRNHSEMKSVFTGCLQLLETLEILESYWNLRYLLEILEIYWS